ncbi:hypothetical protein CMV_018093 [Castanea mollissima]|uniref:Uncharacterized protein n=1 Tax=Castanea mollissima TaxID=60419 RepID=A0A8J4QRS0_9ROSI|nr:hypothetical protein CMV_018093 [Castanea mollissima]
MNNRSMAQRSQKQEIYTTSKKAWSHFALLLILSLKAHLSTASDTMYRGQRLAWNQTLTSKSGIFELGFFTPGKSHKHYVGIWYKTIAELTVVWVANRGCPVYNPSSKALEISEDGNLLITEKGIPFCNCTNSGMPNYTVAVLLDKGNFILRDKLDNKLHDIVRLMVFVAIMASVFSIRHLFVIAQKDLNQGGQEIGSILQDYSGGCIRRTPLGCSNGGIDKFLTMPNMHLGNLFGVATKINGMVQDIEACKLACLRDCDCIAYSCYDECFLYMKQLMNLQISPGTETGEDLYVRISASEQFELVGSRTKMSKKAAWILGVFAMLILLLSIVLAIILWKPSADGALEESEFSLKLFKYRDLQKATKNFSQKLG